MHSRSVLISGIGIAGPTLAWWLAAHGFTPTLVERAPRPRAGGYVIDFWGRGYDVAERMGLLPALLRSGIDVADVRLVADDGRRVGGFDADVFRRLTGGRYVSIQRGTLAQALLRSIERRCETIFGDSIAALAEDDRGVRVDFAHAAPRRFDLVIGADGLHSAVRHLAFGPQAPFEAYLGLMVGAFAIPGYRPREERATVSYGEPGRQVARFALRDDRTMILLVFRAETPLYVDPHDVEGAKSVLRAAFAGAGWETPRILAALAGADEVYLDRVSQIRMPAWSRGRIALVGDAAFCPSLLAGEGAALAMTAAYVLAGELAAADGRHEAAFATAEQRLRGFIADKQHAARRFARSFAPRTRLGLWLRNQITKAFVLPLVAELALGRDLVDRLELPDYADVPAARRPAPA